MGLQCFAIPKPERRPEGVVFFLRQFVWTRSWERRRQKEGSFLEGDRMRAAIHTFSPEAPELQVAKSALCLRFGHWSFLNPVNVNSCQIQLLNFQIFILIEFSSSNCCQLVFCRVLPCCHRHKLQRQPNCKDNKRFVSARLINAGWSEIN